MSDEQIWINLGDLVNEGLDQLFFAGEIAHLRTLSILDLSLEIKGHGLCIKLSYKGEGLELIHRSRAILAHVVVNEARNHCDLIGVLMRAASLDGKTNGRHGGILRLIQVINGHFCLLGVCN